MSIKLKIHKASFKLQRKLGKKTACKICGVKLAMQMEYFISDPYSRYICAQCARELIEKGKLKAAKLRKRLNA